MKPPLPASTHTHVCRRPQRRAGSARSCNTIRSCAARRSTRTPEVCSSASVIVTRPAHFSKALLDGLCCEFSYQTGLLTSALGQEIRSITAVGGPTRSSYLMQRKASISGIELRCPDCQESAAFGAALLGSVGCDDQTFSQIRQIASACLPASGTPAQTNRSKRRSAPTAPAGI